MRSKLVAGAAAALAAGALAVGTSNGPSLPPCPTKAFVGTEQSCAADAPNPPAGFTPPATSSSQIGITIAPPALATAGSNGNLPVSALAPVTGGVSGSIAGEGMLAKAPAAAWNAMAVKVHSATGYWLQSDGSASNYRPYSVQVQLRNYWCSRGACQNAAVPGTSNHGLGYASDDPVPTQSAIKTYGSPYGWSYSCSDAPWESWHAKWCGGWSGHDPGPYGQGGGAFAVLKLGDGGPRVFQLNCRYRHLRRPGHGAFYMHHRTRHFGPGMATATRSFQHDHKLGADGVYGPATNQHLVHRWQRYAKTHKPACHL